MIFKKNDIVVWDDGLYLGYVVYEWLGDMTVVCQEVTSKNVQLAFIIDKSRLTKIGTPEYPFC